MTITHIFYIDNFSTYNFNLDSHNNNHIFIMFLYIFQYLYITYISRIVSYYSQNKRIYVSNTCRIRYTYLFYGKKIV